MAVIITVLNLFIKYYYNYKIIKHGYKMSTNPQIKEETEEQITLRNAKEAKNTQYQRLANMFQISKLNDAFEQLPVTLGEIPSDINDITCVGSILITHNTGTGHNTGSIVNGHTAPITPRPDTWKLTNIGILEDLSVNVLERVKDLASSYEETLYEVFSRDEIIEINLNLDVPMEADDKNYYFLNVVLKRDLFTGERLIERKRHFLDVLRMKNVVDFDIPLIINYI